MAGACPDSLRDLQFEQIERKSQFHLPYNFQLRYPRMSCGPGMRYKSILGKKLNRHLTWPGRDTKLSFPSSNPPASGLTGKRWSTFRCFPVIYSVDLMS